LPPTLRKTAMLHKRWAKMLCRTNGVRREVKRSTGAREKTWFILVTGTVAA